MKNIDYYNGRAKICGRARVILLVMMCVMILVGIFFMWQAFAVAASLYLMAAHYAAQEGLMYGLADQMDANAKAMKQREEILARMDEILDTQRSHKHTIPEVQSYNHGAGMF